MTDARMIAEKCLFVNQNVFKKLFLLGFSGYFCSKVLDKTWFLCYCIAILSHHSIRFLAKESLKNPSIGMRIMRYFEIMMMLSAVTAALLAFGPVIEDAENTQRALHQQRAERRVIDEVAIKAATESIATFSRYYSACEFEALQNQLVAVSGGRQVTQHSIKLMRNAAHSARLAGAPANIVALHLDRAGQLHRFASSHH